jgi:hypothetical protein
MEAQIMRRLLLLIPLVSPYTPDLWAQDLAGIKIHGFATQGLIYRAGYSASVFEGDCDS